MGRPDERSQLRVFLRRRLVVIVAAAFAVSGACGLFWQWRFALPPRTDAAGPLNALAYELTGGLAYDDPENALRHYRTIFIDVLGAPGAFIDWRTDGNAILRAWADARGGHAVADLHAGVWDDPRLDDARALLVTVEPVLEALDRVAECKGFRAPYSASSDIFHPSSNDEPVEMADILLPHLGPFRALAELNAGSMRAAAYAGDWALFERRLRTGLAHARHAASEPFLIALLVGASIESITLEELRFTLLDRETPTDECGRFIDEVLAGGIPGRLAPYLEVERLALGSSIRTTYLKEMSIGDVLRGDAWELLREYPPRKAMRDGDRYFSQIAAHFDMPHSARAGIPAPDPGAAGYYIMDIARAVKSRDAVLTERAATVALLFLEKFHAEHGRWPDALEEAMPRERTLDPVTGKPFVYMVGSDGLRPESDVAHAVEAFTPSDDAVRRTAGHTLGESGAPVGPRWPFTLLAPTEASYMRDREITLRRSGLAR